MPLLALADPAVRNVQVNIHNDTQNIIELKNFSASRLFASTRISEEKIPAHTAEYNAVFFTSFDKEAISAQMNFMLNGKPMIMMWEINLGFGGPGGSKSHICGVVKDGAGHLERDYCDIPYVDNGVLYIDFVFDQE